MPPSTRNTAPTSTPPELLGEAVYALPEVRAEGNQEGTAHRLPWLLPTSILLPLIPLLKAGLLKAEPIAVSSMSESQRCWTQCRRALPVLRSERERAQLQRASASAPERDRPGACDCRRTRGSTQLCAALDSRSCRRLHHHLCHTCRRRRTGSNSAALTRLRMLAGPSSLARCESVP